jgi:hypothetical protein
MALGPFSQSLTWGAFEGITSGAVQAIGAGFRELLKNEGIKEVIKDNAPKLFGLGYVEESEFQSALDCLDPEDARRVIRVRAKLEKKYQKRWQMILATMENEHLVYDPNGPLITAHRQKGGVASSNWGKGPARGPHHAKAGGHVLWTNQDRRVVHLQRVADMVGHPRIGITADREEAVNDAVDSLMTSILSDHGFGSLLVDWLKAFGQFIKNSGKATATTVANGGKAAVATTIKVEAGLVWYLLGLTVGEKRFNEIIKSRVAWSDKLVLFEAALESVVDAKRKSNQARRGLPNSFWALPIGMLGIILFAALIIQSPALGIPLLLVVAAGYFLWKIRRTLRAFLRA